MKLGQLVTINTHFEPASISNKYWSDYLMNYGTEIEPDVYEINRYAPASINISGIVTGYKQLTIKTTYKIGLYPDWERDTGAEITRESCKYVSSTSEPVYVVQTSLTKKYFVKKEWIVGAV